jgi:hypothetical protein
MSYKTIETPMIESVLASVLPLNSERSIRKLGGTAHQITYHTGKLFQVGQDKVELTAYLINSYKGETSFSIGFGLYRLVCSNGLVIGNSLFQAKARHVVGPKVELVLGKLEEELRNVDVETLISKVNALNEYSLPYVNYERIVDDLGLSRKTYREAIRAYSKFRRAADQGDSAWLQYNRLQEVIGTSTIKGALANISLMDSFLVPQLAA